MSASVWAPLRDSGGEDIVFFVVEVLGEFEDEVEADGGDLFEEPWGVAEWEREKNVKKERSAPS